MEGSAPGEAAPSRSRRPPADPARTTRAIESFAPRFDFTPPIIRDIDAAGIHPSLIDRPSGRLGQPRIRQGDLKAMLFRTIAILRRPCLGPRDLHLRGPLRHE